LVNSGARNAKSGNAQGQQRKARAVLCMLKTNIHDHTVFRIRLDELRTLVETLGMEVVGEFVQTEPRPFPRFFMGKGKVEEIGGFVKGHDVDVVVMYNIINSSQKLNLIRAFHCDVVDRYEVILEIFDKNASDNVSRLQIEAARLQKLTPYFKLATAERFRHDRPFFLSMGEYAYHSQLRELTSRQAKLRGQIEALKKEKRQQIRKRRSLGFPLICIAGYYNAGKTSLFNALTGDSKLVTPLPFTTLSSKYQRRYVDAETTLLFIDSIGFVIDLDPRLIQSFELNLEDMRSADLVLLVLEINDPVVKLRIKLLEGIRLLNDIGIPREKIIIVLNKIDLAPKLAGTISETLEIERLEIPWTIVSAKDRTNLDGLIGLITGRLRQLREPQKIEEKATVVESS